MIEAPLALGFTAGMVATVNPCGFAMLPAYLSYFLGVEDRPPGEPGGGVLRAFAVGATVSAGFLVVFGAAGALISHLSLSLYEYAPWVTIVIGTALAALGVAMLAGFELTVALPKLERGTGGRGMASMFVFGVSYAIASLSCTLPVFLSAVSGTFSRENFVSGVAVFGAYAAGMALVLMVLTVTLALARDSLVRLLRQSMRYVTRAAGALLVVAGAYVAWYGIYELRLDDPTPEGSAPVDLVTDLSTEIQRWVDDVGGVNVGLGLAVIAGAVLLAVLARRLRAD